jgi:DNA-binding response OmpR family regulator
MDTILAVHTDLKVHEIEAEAWAKIDVDIERVETMQEAIRLLKSGETYIFVAIIEDSIPNFFLDLSVMRDATDLPIFVMTSDYTTEKKAKAINLGADGYDYIDDWLENHVYAGLALLDWQNRRASKSSDEKQPIVVGGDIILSLSRHVVLVKGAEVHLTKKEIGVLHCLMQKKGRLLSYTQLLGEVWGDEQLPNGHNVLWQVVKRIRQKLSDVSDISSDKKYIISERNVGYKFIE